MFITAYRVPSMVCKDTPVIENEIFRFEKSGTYELASSFSGTIFKGIFSRKCLFVKKHMINFFRRDIRAPPPPSS